MLRRAEPALSPAVLGFDNVGRFAADWMVHIDLYRRTAYVQYCSDSASLKGVWGAFGDLFVICIGLEYEMDAPPVRARHYSQRALSLREMALLDENPRTQRALLAVAEQYDTLCEKLLNLPANSNSIS